MTKRVILSHMPESTKGNTLRLYLRDEELKQLGKLTDTLEISQTEIMGRIMSAGIRAIVRNGNKMPLPLKFIIPHDDTGRFELNEQEHETKHRK